MAESRLDHGGGPKVLVQDVSCPFPTFSRGGLETGRTLEPSTDINLYPSNSYSRQFYPSVPSSRPRFSCPGHENILPVQLSVQASLLPTRHDDVRFLVVPDTGGGPCPLSGPFLGGFLGSLPRAGTGVGLDALVRRHSVTRPSGSFVQVTP